MKKAKKCVECGEYHTRKSKESDYNEVGERCTNCTLVLESFWGIVDALNRHQPLTGRPRRIEILGYKITKV